MDSHARRKIKRKKRPSCPTCKSRRWRRDDEGFLVCPYGHQMRGYVQEEQDEEAGIANNSRKQSIRKKRRRHTQSLHARAGLIPLTVLCEMFQMSLRLQVEGLAKNAGFGSELEKMVLHLWMSYIHSHGFTHDLNDRIVKDSGWRSGAESDMDAYSSGYESTNTMASDHPTYANTVRKRVMRKAQTSRKGELSVSATGGGPQGYTQENWSAGGEMSDGWLTTAGESSMGGTEDEMSLGEKSSGWVTSAGQEEESAEDLSADGVDGDQDIKNEIERGSNLRFIEPIYTLGFIYLACRCLHLPVLMADIQNMALSGVIPYLTLYKQVHQNFPGKQYEPVEQKSPPRRKHLLQAIWAILARLKSFTQSEPFPFLNLPPLWIRALGAAGLDPEVFYPDVAALWRITQVGVQQDKKRKNPATISYKEEAEAISVVLIAFKLRVGATGYGSDPEVTRWTDYYVSRRPVAVKKQFAVWNSV
ncbi:hypothetical protein DFS34DRAFT_101378 [Phlyctochytrium arcticum]|nr:hypothetical protein DFS34DRAFT_101378 [Phlyctochytrium arcticum]